MSWQECIVEIGGILGQYCMKQYNLSFSLSISAFLDSWNADETSFGLFSKAGYFGRMFGSLLCR